MTNMKEGVKKLVSDKAYAFKLKCLRSGATEIAATIAEESFFYGYMSAIADAKLGKGGVK